MLVNTTSAAYCDRMTSPDVSNDTPYNEYAAMQDILRWSETRESWQKDALRRIVLNGNLSDVDLSELEAICIDEKAAFEPLKTAHLGKGAATTDPISITEIANPKQINALAKSQKITFVSQGLNIVYGDNGTGKSGFVRILKHACRSRDPNLKVLRDVTNPTDEPQSAEIHLKRGMDTEVFNWAPDQETHPDLSSVSIFDSRSANIHVEKTNELAYTPFPMQVFEQLSIACAEISSRIDARIKIFEAQTPAAISSPKLNEETKSGNFVARLSAKSSLETLDKLAGLSQAEQDEFDALQSDLAQSPEQAASRLRAQSERLSKAMRLLRALHNAVTDGEVSSLQNLRTNLADKQALSIAASEQLFTASPLPKIGERLWRDLWEAAREYSDTDAYPDKKFPEAEVNNDLCVLCQQPLSEKAIEHRQTFESFVKSKTRASEDAAKLALNSAIFHLAQVSVPASFSRELRQLVTDEIGNTTLAEKLRRNSVLNRLRLRTMTQGEKPQTKQETLPEAEVSQVIDSLATRLAQLTSDATSPDRLALLSRYAELTDRRKITDLRLDIVAEIERKVKIQSLKVAKKTASKRAVTDKNKEISDKLITDALRGRFAREVTKLQIGSMPIELQKTDRNAQTYFRVCFVERPTEPVGDVLSEGEHRCVALAAFLAELVTSQEYSGIVFDDPMSSLDHLNRKTVAKRLVEEAAHRQVIIFTHDLTFLFELKRAAEANSITPHYQHVHRRNNEPGYISGALPLKARPGLELVNSLRSELKAIKHEFDSYSHAQREITVKGYLEKFREAWDQGIADFIMPVLGRFDNTIKGGSLNKLLVLSDEDVKTVTAARSRLSDEMHVNSEALNPAEISHADLVSEVAILENWLASIKERQKNSNQLKRPLFEPAASYSQ